MKLNFDTSEATFLFDEKINDRIKLIYEKSIDLASMNEQLNPTNGSKGLPVGEKRTEVVNKQNETLKWLVNQLVELKPLFHKHLGLKD